MRAIRFLLAAGCVGLAATGAGAAESGLRWEPTLDAAKRLGAQTNRFVLVHFSAPWCKPCLRLEKEVLSKPELGDALAESFVAVKLNADNFPATARQYGVTSLPADVILSPSGQRVALLSCPADYAQYVGQLRQVAANAAGRVDSPYADLNVPPAVTPPAPRAADTAPAFSATPTSPGPAFSAAPAATAQTPVDASNPYADVFRTQTAPSSSITVPPATNANLHISDPAAPPASMASAAPSTPAGNPPLGLEGYCPVELVEHKRWVKGDPRWGAIHNGRTYLFAGPEQQQRFLPNGDAYSPVMSGNDPVAAIDHNQEVQGKRKFGVFYNRRIYLFADPASKDLFSRSPERYSIESLQARRAAPGQPINR